MLRRSMLLVSLAILLASCGATSPRVPLYELLEKPERYQGQEVTVFGYYYQDAAQRLLVVGMRTDDGYQNPVPLGDPIWVDGMPQQVIDQLVYATGTYYGIVEIRGRFETGGHFGPRGDIPHRLVVSSPGGAVSLEEQRMQQAWVPQEYLVSGTLSLADLLAQPEAYSGKQVTVVAYYYWTPPRPDDPNQAPTTCVLAEGIRSVDGLHYAVPIGRQIWVDGFPPKVAAALNVVPSSDRPTNIHGLVKVTGRLDTRGGYGTNQAYPYRIVVRSAEALRPK
ncbi:MAG: hypothetical protein ACP5SI_00320 [Chloroflexia bacterium]